MTSTSTSIQIVSLNTPKDFKVTPETKKQLSQYYKKVKWSSIENQSTITLDRLSTLDTVYIVPTTGLTIIDFDTDDSFEEALRYNSQLQQQYQCAYIVKSLRKGGHFYYLENKEIQLPAQHTKQSTLDILSGPAHNVIAPTLAETGKEVLYHSDTYTLTPYNTAINTLISNIVINSLPKNARVIALSPLERNSDNAASLIKEYLANLITQVQFNEFYSLPDPIPPQQSNEVYKRLSTRLASDLTISHEDYIATMEKYNHYTGRKTQAELHSEHIQRMLNNTNGLWRYDPDAVAKQVTYIVTHKETKTPIEVFYDADTGEYLVSYKNSRAQQMLHHLKNKSAYIELMEKITRVRPEQLRRDTTRIKTVSIYSDYSKDYGYNDNKFNIAIHNRYLQAFNGAKPDTYTTPEEFIELLEYMWGDEYEYLIGAMKYRYSTFEYTPVVTHIVGEEGTGKDLSINIMTKGFSEPAQSLDYTLMKDKHSNWQTKENVIFSEVGEWKFAEQDDMLERLKTISGSNGIVTYRGMQQTATTVQSIIKIWVTGNNWAKLHTDINSSRRIHTVYMPMPLEKLRGGNYDKSDLDALMSEASLLDFYYWLGNECTITITREEYSSAYSRQKSQSYLTYIEATSDKSDTASNLLYKDQRYETYSKVLEMFQLSPADIEYKYNKSNDYLVNAKSLQDKLKASGASYILSKTVDNIVARTNNNKRVIFDSGKYKYITILNAPKEIEEVQGEDIDLS